MKREELTSGKEIQWWNGSDFINAYYDQWGITIQVYNDTFISLSKEDTQDS